MRKTMKTAAVLAAMSVMVLGTVATVSAAEAQGWVKKGNDWYYNDSKGVAYVNKWAQDSAGKWYFLGDEGKMVTKKIVNDSDKAVVDADEVNDDDNFYYVGSDGAMLTGWLEVEASGESSPVTGASKDWYYFGADGRMYTDSWVMSGDKWYFLDTDGAMIKNAFENGYYVNNDGAMITGWYKTVDKGDELANLDNIAKDKWIYAGTDGKPVSNKWKKIDGSWYYFGETDDFVGQNTEISGGAVTGSAVDSSYQMVAETFLQTSEGIFYLKSSGAMVTGWFKVDKQQYWANTDGKVAYSAIKEINNKWYLFMANGICKDSKWAVDGDTTQVFADEDAAINAAGVNGKIYKLGTGTKKTVTQTMWDAAQ